MGAHRMQHGTGEVRAERLDRRTTDHVHYRRRDYVEVSQFSTVSSLRAIAGAPIVLSSFYAVSSLRAICGHSY